VKPAGPATSAHYRNKNGPHGRPGARRDTLGVVTARPCALEHDAENVFGIKNQEANEIWIWFEFLSAPTLLRKNLNNSTKFSLSMIFRNINLDNITYIKKFEDPLQVAGLKNRKDLNLNLNWH
jgi:hypothetical protein